MERIEIREAARGDAPAIAEIHLTARREAMPYLHRPHTDDDARAYFARVVGDRPSAWWVAWVQDQIVGFMLIDGKDSDHLYGVARLPTPRHRIVAAIRGLGAEPAAARTLGLSAQHQCQSFL